MYIRDVIGSVVRPLRELKQKGESTTVSFTITEDMLKFYGIKMNYTSEPGQFIVYIGSDSTTKNKKEFILEPEFE
ncbi:fibronectin type III-like domain-contianing protein [Paenibacillus crassostreae]|uniref:Fibronectin type III-like domain-containing protein n=1 Tax=Paenibacillus crassostreae TaxID=1763538 RepID=A0A167DX39_9BACL|nr:fibronectin type III-like domain-contianing protein [Paenibacillus crassostreae]AOZ90956.1 hypothetical protein LPB68_01230 [Paenibacillus crassostreae]OAB74881.1 hypothetical protein PNBC_12725 [Paenibacillus crassostreae]